MATMKPTVFGKYQLLERIAVGGMAEIFLARSDSLGGVTRDCCIKRILPEYSCDRQFVSMFIDEARITIGLDHANIVRLFDFGQVDGTYFMAMEFVDGKDLVDLLRHNKREGHIMDPRAAAYIARCIARALHHAHVQQDYRGLPLGVVHRDVSPHNVFLSWQGDVKVGDFGIAAARNKLTVTQAGTVKGKFAYMAPEQATGGLMDSRADVWAVGVVLHEMLTGSRLFAAESPVVTVSRVVEGRVPRPQEKRPDLPDALDEAVMHALIRPVDQRFQTAADLADALDSYLEEGGGYGPADLARLLTSLDWESATVTATKLPRVAPSGEEDALPSAVHRVRDVHDDGELRALLAELGREPDLWTLVRIGERHKALGHTRAALSAFRTAAAVFSHRGHLVQSLCAFGPAQDLLSKDDVLADLLALGALRGEPRQTLQHHLAGVDNDGFWTLLRAVDRDGLGAEESEQTLLKRPTPLFAGVPAADFARLAEACKVRQVAVGETVVLEGERGSSLFGVGRGRLVVHCQPGTGAGSSSFPGQEIPGARELLEQTLSESGDEQRRRIYLSALADGDFFGEFSFLTGRRRSATVEAITACTLLEIDQETAEKVLRTDPAFKEPLLEFYKDRVGELMMAKNPVFAILSPDDRRELLARSSLRKVSDGELVVAEGEISEEVFFIKNGEVEVYQQDSEMPVFINKLREGEFFGEMAALHRTARSASVRAMGEVELFCIRRADLDAILSREERLRQLFEAAIAWRSAESRARMAESRRIFEGI